jgi:hypothetical protein
VRGKKKIKRDFMQVIMLEMSVSKVLELLEGIFFQYFGCNQGCEIELNKTKL